MGKRPLLVTGFGLLNAASGCDLTMGKCDCENVPHVVHHQPATEAPPVADAERYLLTQLRLTTEQQLAICLQIKIFTSTEKKLLQEKYEKVFCMRYIS